MLPIILGSRSSDRQAILRQMGYEFELMPADIDEKVIRCENPVELTLGIAYAKAAKLIPQISRPALLITSDQVIYMNGRICEKPADVAEARIFLNSLSLGLVASVTAVVVVNLHTTLQLSTVNVACVKFNSIPSKHIDALVADEKVMNQAGAIDILHALMAPYVDMVIGERESVRGLPREQTERLIREAERGGGEPFIAHKYWQQNEQLVL